ncbi:MAG: hypothetical protein ACOC95_00335 [Planctomycetota bacterium]
MRRMTLATALLVVAALAVPADARTDEQDQQKQDQQKQDMQERSPRKMGAERQQVQGEIVEVRTVKVKQTRQDHLMAKVKLDTGQTAVLDLGAAAEARQSGLKLEKGRQLQAEGTVGQLNNRPVLVVTRARQDGKTVMMNAGKQGGDQPQGAHGYQEGGSRQKGSEQESREDMQAGDQEKRMTQVQGRIMDVSTVKSEQDQTDHLVAEIRLQQTGQTVKADMGPADQARQSGLNLSQGQKIQVTGTVGRLNGMSVVVVQRAQQDDKSVMLNAGSQQHDRPEQDRPEQDRPEQSR